MVKTPPSHGGIMGPNPVGVTKKKSMTASCSFFHARRANASRSVCFCTQFGPRLSAPKPLSTNPLPLFIIPKPCSLVVRPSPACSLAAPPLRLARLSCVPLRLAHHVHLARTLSASPLKHSLAGKQPRFWRFFFRLFLFAFLSALCYKFLYGKRFEKRFYQKKI